MNLKPILMKSFIQLLLVLYVSLGAKAQDIETFSTTIDGLNGLIVDALNSEVEDEMANPKNLVFLFETKTGKLSYDNKIKLKQSFRLLSSRLTSDDNISILVFSGKNGIVLRQTSATDLKTILHTIEHFSDKIETSNEVGLNLAYQYVEEYTNYKSEDSVIIIRNIETSPNQMVSEVGQSGEPKPKKNQVLLTAITLLPEIIALIKE